MTIQTTPLANGDTVALMETTHGTITFKLFSELAPKTVANFVGLAKQGYYDGIIFHRVIRDFMIQSGDPTGTGMGGNSIYGKDFEDEFSSELTHMRGALSMANAGPNTNGSQFFIVHAPSVSSLDFVHAIFGQVVDGMKVVDDIAYEQTDRNDKPRGDVKMLSVTIKTWKDGKLED